ncbi:metallophosphoesterase family protein [Halorhodospira neutriphila]|uniref:metallophosphoesterase family protein n=1 Tax=Halorhodospira neutriphila TaxID=168379 RepID=UPI001A932223|nr:DNA repair exonuclease [Halorhodospira neutriphila]
MAIHLLHTADWQIGKGFGPIPGDDGAALRNQRLETVTTLAELARTEEVDAVLVAGDVFDAQSVSDRTIRQLFERLRAFPGPWILLPGNHDAAVAESVWDRARRLGAVPEHVYLATEPAPILLEEAGLAVLPAPLQRRHEPADVTAWLDAAEIPAGYTPVGLAHGSVTGFLPAEAEAANPIAPDRAATANLAYLALGDWHGTLQVNERTWYAGTPETDRFTSSHPGNALLVTLPGDGGSPAVETRATTRYRWHRLSQPLHEPDDVVALGDRLASLGEPTTDQVVDLTLRGALTLADKADLDELLAAWRGRLRHLRVDDTELTTRASEADLAALDGAGFVATAAERLRQGAEAGEPADATALEMLLAAYRRQGGG